MVSDSWPENVERLGGGPDGNEVLGSTCRFCFVARGYPLAFKLAAEFSATLLDLEFLKHENKLERITHN